jgi:transposase
MKTTKTRSRDPTQARPLRRREKKELLRWKRQHSNAVNALHARIILLSRGGLHNKTIAEQVDCSPQWVRCIIRRFNADGICGIVWFPFFNAWDAPRKFVYDIREQIFEIALSPPKVLIGMQQWSLPKLRAYLIEQKVVPSISVEWLRQLLHRAKVRLRRTKTWKESNDPNFHSKSEVIRRLYRRRPDHGRRLSIDEFGPLRLQPRHGRCFACPDKLRVHRIRANYDRPKEMRHFLAFYDLETGRLYGRFTKNKRRKQWFAFLKWVRSRYPKQQRLHIVTDNYPTHLGVAMAAWAFAQNVQFYFTPTNASWLNRIESHFTALKQFAMKPSDFRSFEELQEAIESYLAWHNRRRPLSRLSWKEYQHTQKKAA